MVQAVVNSTASYSWLERLLYRLAFAGVELQKNIAEIEALSVRAELDAIKLTRPIFVTSLPRAGTTLLLEIIVSLGDVVSQTYRDMPFVLAPLTWARLSRRFHKAAETRERAHLDGMMIGFDSAEEFEEVVWKSFWKGKYRRDRIELWDAGDYDPEFASFLKLHMKKIIFLRAKNASEARYASKNNANLSRLALLEVIFPDCDIVVPFREPVAQARSLLRQHMHFLRLHSQDPFSLRYMEYLGHFEFGRALRPISFPEFNLERSATTLEFWLNYWLSAFRRVLDSAGGQVLLVNYDKLTVEPVRQISMLRERLALPGDVNSLAARIRRPTVLAGSDAVLPATLRKCRELYAELSRVAICSGL